MILAQNFKLLVTLSVDKMDPEKMFGDVLQSNQSDPLHIWRCQIWTVAILDFFQRGQPMILGQNFKFFLTWSMVKLDLEILLSDDLE